MNGSLITEVIVVRQLTNEGQTGFTVDRKLYFIEITAKFLRELTSADIKITVLRDGELYEEGYFDYHKNIFHLPKCIEPYLERKELSHNEDLDFLTVYMFEPGDVLELSNLNEEFGDIRKYDDMFDMDYAGHWEDLGEY